MSNQKQTGWVDDLDFDVLAYQPHTLEVSNVQYPGGLRIVECTVCDYAFAAEVDSSGILKMDTKEVFNYGDTNASHSLFQTPEIDLELRVTAEMEPHDPHKPHHPPSPCD